MIIYPDLIRLLRIGNNVMMDYEFDTSWVWLFIHLDTNVKDG